MKINGPAQLYEDLSRDLNRIAARFKSPIITLVVRDPQLPDGDVVLTSESPADIELTIAAIRRLFDPPKAGQREFAAYAAPAGEQGKPS